MSRAARLAELRALRASGKSRISTYEVDEVDRVYDLVDDDQYKRVVRKRLDEDDFVVDDNGEGYADDGREDWQDRPAASEGESEEDAPLRGKAAKRKREEDRESREKITNGINKYFSAKNTMTAPKAKPITTAEDTAFMADLLGEVDVNIPSRRATARAKPVRDSARRKVRVLSPPISGRQSATQNIKREDHVLNSPPQEPTYVPDDDDDGLPVMHDDAAMSDALPSSPVIKAIQRKQIPVVKEEPEDDDDLMEVEAISGHATGVSSVNMSGQRPPPKIKKEFYPTPASSSPPPATPQHIDAAAWNKVTDRLNVMSSPATPSTASIGKVRPQDAMEDDGTLRMFWTDYTEINGSLCLFGKVKDKSNGKFVSSFLKIDNIQRKLYFLPREFRHKRGQDTDDSVGLKDVYEEVDALMSRLKIGTYKAKPCEMKYAFELPGIPKEADYLQLLYPYDKPALSMDITGETYSHVFGTNTALFEQFVLEKNILGPCWLTIKDADFQAVNTASWCKLEAQIAKPISVSVLSDGDLDAPPLTLMSIALRTTYNAKDNKQEILMASARVYDSISLSDTTPTEKLLCKTFTIMRPLGNAYPIGFNLEVNKHKGMIGLEQTEQALLSKFMAIFAQMDPDVLIGHRLDDVDFSILLNRMRERKTPGWHRIGRLRRSEWPKLKGSGSIFAERQLASGRLLCDLANDMGKSLMTKCQSWSLNEMTELVLGDSRREIDIEAALKTWATSRDGLMNFVRHCEADTFFIAAIAIKVQMLPLTKVLTNLAGNSWARTLSGTRAERNEYILLHEFHQNNYICPDKMFNKSKPSVEDEEGEEGADTKKKDKFKGGLVFEPEKGLYDKFILVMDFNSLYPSIIQEYNICFTTVERADFQEDAEGEKVPEIPKEQAQGILPKLISTLVKRRREVKKLMKDKTATPDQLASWDIKQLALKLTANSMYGCLGYTKSRFYARPLAMLTTAKGREILRSTKDLAESQQLRVIYGDTDSVMINTNMDNPLDAMNVGREFKKAVNERYRLLEIDIDNIFRRLLLHAKKKYAAVNTFEVDGKWVEKIEVKGLDMRRREFCQLSKDTSQKLLGFLLSGEDLEVVVENIHAHLRELAEQMREYKVPVQKYTIYTQLGKDPKDYPNGNSMPSVQVALKQMAKGKLIKAKDVMSFIITGESSGSAESAAKNAWPLDDILKSDSELKPDINYYLHKQILPPVERLCAPIDGTNVTRLAECLGLDTSKYKVNSGANNANQEVDMQPLESQIPESVRFKDSKPLGLRCRACHSRFAYGGLTPPTTSSSATSFGGLSHDGIQCPTATCGAVLSNISIVAQMECQIRQHIARYYSGWLICDDAACGNRTRQMSVYGHRCLGPQGRGQGCLGRMQFEYTEKMLYNQLLYLSGLFDTDKLKNQSNTLIGKKEGGDNEKASVLAACNRERFDTVKGVVDAYLEKNGRQWVQMDSLFAFAMPKR